MSQDNIIRCKYCDWSTLRFRGKKHGETALRNHVLESHEAEYAAAQGLAAIDLDHHQWNRDSADIGEQAL